MHVHPTSVDVFTMGTPYCPPSSTNAPLAMEDTSYEGLRENIWLNATAAAVLSLLVPKCCRIAVMVCVDLSSVHASACLPALYNIYLGSILLSFASCKPCTLHCLQECSHILAASYNFPSAFSCLIASLRASFCGSVSGFACKPTVSMAAAASIVKYLQA